MTLAPYTDLKGKISVRLGQFISVIVKGLISRSVANALSASTTHTQAGGTPLTTEINVLATVANAGDAATLGMTSVGQSQEIYNAGAHSAQIFPFGASDTIDGGSPAASVSLAAGKRASFTLAAPNIVISAQLGAASA